MVVLGQVRALKLGTVEIEAARSPGALADGAVLAYHSPRGSAGPELAQVLDDGRAP